MKKSTFRKIAPAYAILDHLGCVIGTIIIQDENCVILTEKTIIAKENGYKNRIISYQDITKNLNLTDEESWELCDEDVIELIIDKVISGEL